MDAWTIHPYRLFDLLTATVALLMAATVLRAAPGKPANQAFALFMVLIAGNFLAGFVTWGLRCPDAAPGSLYGTSCFGLFRLSERVAFQFQVFDPAALLYFALLFPRRDALLDRPTTFLALGGPPVALTLAALAAPWAFLPGHLDYPGEPGWSLGWVAEAYLAVAYVAALLLLLRNLARERSELLQGQLALLVVGFGVALLPRVGLAAESIRSQLLPLEFRDPWSAAPMFLVRALPTLLGTALVCRWLLRLAPQGRFRRAARSLAALVGIIVLLWLGSQATSVYGTAFLDIDGGALFNALVFSFRWVVFASVVGYALLRYQILDVATSMRQFSARAIGGALLLAVVLVAWSGAAAVEPLARQLGWGQLLVLMVVAMAAPAILRVGRTASERVLPVPATGDTGTRRLEMYRASLEASMKEGSVAPDREAELRQLRRDLRITEEQHRVLLDILRSGGRTGTPRPLQGGALLGGRYELGKVLGRGSFGQVRLARDALLGRNVVVKEVPSLAGGASGLLGEARAAGRIHHPNIVTVYDVVEGTGSGYLVMEYAERGNLREALRTGTLSVEERRGVLRDLLAGLAAAHARGIVHGDLKPENILLTAEGQAKLADFGSAHAGGGAGTMVSLPSRAGPGTLPYLAPEQVRGEPASSASDLYAMAAIAHEVMAGRHYLDIQGKGDFDVREAILRSTPRLEGLDPAWEAWMRRGLQKEPAARWASAEAMQRSLPPPPAGPSPAGRGAGSRPRR